MPLKQNYSNLWKKIEKRARGKKKVCVKVKNTEKSGRETTFLPVKKLPKGAKKWFHVQFCFLREKKRAVY